MSSKIRKTDFSVIKYVIMTSRDTTSADDLGGKGALFLLTRFINLFYLLKIIMGIRSPHMLEEVVGLGRIVSLLLP